MGPGAVRAERKLEDGYAPGLAVAAVVLASSTVVAYGPPPARRSQTSIGGLKAMIRVCIMMGKLGETHSGCGFKVTTPKWRFSTSDLAPPDFQLGCVCG